MTLRILPLLLAGLLMAGTLEARSVNARIARVVTPVAVMEGVSLRLEWPEGAAEGQLHLRVRRVDAGDLGYRFDDLDWRCPLRRAPENGWACAGEINGKGGAPMRLALHLDDGETRADLGRGESRLALYRNAKTPDITRIELTQVPLQWAQALAAQAWQEARLQKGQMDGAIDIVAASDAPLVVRGGLTLGKAGLETRDASTVVDNLDARFTLDYRSGRQQQIKLAGDLRGEALFGQTYLALTERRVPFVLEAESTAAGTWRLPRIEWQDADALRASGRLALNADAGIDQIEMRFDSRRMDALSASYLSGALGQLGLADVALSGALHGEVAMRSGQLQAFNARFEQVDLRDPRARFGLQGLHGELAFSADQAVDSVLHWRQADVFGMHFEAAEWRFASRDGVLGLQRPARLLVFGGEMAVHDLRLHPLGERGARVEFGLDLDGIDVGQMAKALDLPEFRGELSGEIPRVTYADDVLDFDGGLSIGFFEGAMQITQLRMERPFGTAPTLSADLDFNDLDLLRLTEVFGFGSITGKLDGHVHDLRLVDWQPVRFDAVLRTDRKRGVRQRISQRAVQNISSVGDASFMSTLQGQLIGFFDDFGYRRIGIRCRLENEVCLMDGLEAENTPRSASSSFTIVEGAGLPRLNVIGHNRRVDWPTFLERLKAASSGDVSPVID